MPIARISLTNFKGISATTSIDLRPVTLLFGANSAGKSSVLQAMLYAREILERRNTDSDRTAVGGAAVDLGGFRNLVHKHDVELPIVLRFDLDLSSVDLIDYVDNAASEVVAEALSGEAKSAWVQMTVTWGRFADEPIQADYEVGIDGMPAARIASEPAQGGRHAVFYNARHTWFGFEADTSDIEREYEPDWVETRSSRIDGRVAGNRRFDTLFDEIRFVLASHDLGDYPEEFAFVLLAPGQYLLHCLKQLRYVGPIRIVPDRTYQPSRSPDESRWSDGLAAWDWIHDASTTQLAVLNEWLTRADRLNTGYRVDVKHYKELDTDSMAMVALAQGSDFLDHYEMIQKEIEVLPVKTRILLRQERDFLDVMPQDVGIGISQVIPVVVSALIPGDGITIIEQPELHIHPAIQVALGDLFIQQTHDMAGTGKQFIIETHSEHLLLRLLRRMRETAEGSVPADLELAPDRVAVYYVEAGIAGTQIKNLGLNENGRFTDRWPRGFFEEREQEYFGDQQDISDELGRLFGE
jgi:predicted ATPase